MTIKPGAVATYYDRAAETLATITILNKLLSKFRVTKVVLVFHSLARLGASCEAQYEGRYRHERHRDQLTFWRRTHHGGTCLRQRVFALQESPSILACT